MSSSPTSAAAPGTDIGPAAAARIVDQLGGRGLDLVTERLEHGTRRCGGTGALWCRGAERSVDADGNAEHAGGAQGQGRKALRRARRPSGRGVPGAQQHVEQRRRVRGLTGVQHSVNRRAVVRVADLGTEVHQLRRVASTPTRPQNEAGLRTEPAPSVPWATADSPAATDAAAPPLDPPGVRSGSHGLRVVPFSSDEVMLVQNSGMFVFPMITKPASRNLETTGPSTIAPTEPASTLLNGWSAARRRRRRP